MRLENGYYRMYLALGLYNQAYEAYTKKKFEKTPEYILSTLDKLSEEE